MDRAVGTLHSSGAGYAVCSCLFISGAVSVAPCVVGTISVLCCAMLCCAGCSNCPCRQSNHSRPHDPQCTPRDKVWLALPSPGPSKLWNQGKRGSSNNVHPETPQPCACSGSNTGNIMPVQGSTSAFNLQHGILITHAPRRHGPWQSNGMVCRVG